MGVGGSGKTQLAFHYATQYEKEFSPAFWVNGKDNAGIREDYADIAWRLRLPEAIRNKPESLVDSSGEEIAIQAVKEWFTDHEEGDWLLIIDNADNLEGVDLEEYIPPTKRGHVIITSQDKQAAVIGAPIELGTMEAEDAKQQSGNDSAHVGADYRLYRSRDQSGLASPCRRACSILDSP
jgi:hypothetical protein